MSDVWSALKKVHGGSTRQETKKKLFNHVWGQMRMHHERKPPLINIPEKSDFVKSRKAKIVYSNMNKLDGYLDINDDKIFLVIRSSLRSKPRKLRTVIAHELGHTFLLDIENRPIEPYYSSSLTTHQRWEQVEGLAFEIGRQILVPEVLMKKYVHSIPSLELFIKLKRTFRVTTHVIARRLVHDLKLWDAYLFASSFDSKHRGFSIPRHSNRFKAKESFRNFRLDKYWNKIEPLLSKNPSDEVAESCFAKLGRRFYRIETKMVKDSNWVLCLLTKI